MTLLTFRTEINAKDLSNFIEFWSNYYDFKMGTEIYDKLITKIELTEEDIKKLFIWKNGMTFDNHKKKEKSIETVTAKRETINRLKKNFNKDRFDNEFSTISPIWRIFLLHIIHPNKFPIFDQHVYRAYQYIETGKSKEIPNSAKYKMDFYLNEYINFFDKIENEVPDRRKIDRALWAFGKFLKTVYCKEQTDN